MRQGTPFATSWKGGGLNSSQTGPGAAEPNTSPMIRGMGADEVKELKQVLAELDLKAEATDQAVEQLKQDLAKVFVHADQLKERSDSVQRRLLTTN